MLRLREEIVSNNLKNGTDQENANYSYQIAYHFGRKNKSERSIDDGVRHPATIGMRPNS